MNAEIAIVLAGAVVALFVIAVATNVQISWRPTGTDARRGWDVRFTRRRRPDGS